MRSFYQDRLGTNMGKALKKEWDRFLRKYLPDDAFASELGMEKAAFDAMPKWKQTKALKKAELF
jgi:hypothetical protein